jgi:protein-disulfide isomerase
LAFHEHAAAAAEAVLAAGAQGKFWPMHDLLFANHDQLEEPRLAGYAKQAGLDVATFQRDMDAHKLKPALEAIQKEAALLGVKATPTVFVNGRRVEGVRPVDFYRELIDQDLGRRAP